MYDYVCQIIGYENEPEFCYFAFGEGFRDKNALELMQTWNNLHRDELTLHAHGDMKKDIDQMVEIWRRSKEL